MAWHNFSIVMACHAVRLSLCDMPGLSLEGQISMEQIHVIAARPPYVNLSSTSVTTGEPSDNMHNMRLGVTPQRQGWMARLDLALSICVEEEDRPC